MEKLYLAFACMIMVSACSDHKVISKSEKSQVADCIRFNSIWDRNLIVINELLDTRQERVLLDSEKSEIQEALKEIRSIKYQYKVAKEYCTKHDPQKGYFELHKSVYEAIKD